MQKKIKNIISRIIIVWALYILIDYINLPSLIGIVLDNINIDVFGILFNTTVVLILYVISFYYIDNKQNEKDENAKDCANLLIEKTYQECLENLEFLDNEIVIREYIIPKIDGNKLASENKVISNLQELPFASYEAIITLASSGYVEKDKLDSYLNIKKEYQYLVNVKITFYDLIEPKTADQWAMHNDIQSRDISLRKKLENSIMKTEFNQGSVV